MNIIVCCKPVLDPELPPANLNIDTAKNEVVAPAGVERVVISPFDDNAVEAALRIKETRGGKVTAISMGADMLRNVVRKPVAMGADELILLEDEAYTGADSWSTAYALAMAIKKIGDFDIIFCGRQAADWDAGQVGSGIAEILGLPSVTLAKKIDVADGKATVERVTDDGHEVIEVSLPVLITVSNELGEARSPKIKGIMSAKRKGFTIWKPEDIGLSPPQVGAAGRRTQLLKLFEPVREVTCEIIEGETLEEAGANMAMRLREMKIL